MLLAVDSFIYEFKRPSEKHLGRDHEVGSHCLKEIRRRKALSIRPKATGEKRTTISVNFDGIWVRIEIGWRQERIG